MASININDEVPYNQYVASQGNDTFAYTFPIFSSDEMEAYRTPNGFDPDDSADILVFGTDYTLTGIGTSGGNVVLTTASFPNGADAGDIITLTRKTNQQRTTQFTNGNQITADVLNEQLNSLVMMVQDVRRYALSLSPTYQNSETIAAKDLELPILSARQLWMMNATNTGITPVSFSDPDGCSTLRSELASDQSGSDGALIVGFDSSVVGGTTVHDELDRLISTAPPIADNINIVKNATDATKQIKFDASAITTATTRTITMPDKDVDLGHVSVIGDIKPNNGTSMPGWLQMGSGSIGNASSSGTARANADTEELFTHLWDNYPDATCAVSGGRGASAAADFAANKNIALPPNAHFLTPPGTLSFALAITSVDDSTDELTLASTERLWHGAVVQFTTSNTLPGGLTTSTDYYVQVVNDTTIKVATTSSNLNAGTFIDIADTGIGNHNLTLTSITFTKGALGGQPEATLTEANLAGHTHSYAALRTVNGGGYPLETTASNGEIQSLNTGDKGSDEAFSIVNPYLAVTHWIYGNIGN